MGKRIIVQDYAGYPFPVQLSRKLAQRGHTVLHLYAGYNRTPRGDMQVSTADPPHLTIEGLYTRQPLEKYKFVKRWFQEREYGRLVAKRVADFRPDVVISADMPLDPQAMLLIHCRQNQVRFVFWLQDLISLATRSVLHRKLSWVGDGISAYYLSLEKHLLHQSDHIIPIAPAFEAFLSEAGISPQKVTVIPNWAVLDDLPVQSKENPWARANGLADSFCFLYSGTLGFKHKYELLLQLAQSFQHSSHVNVYVGSESPGADLLIQEKEERGLERLIVQGYQPFNLLPQVLAAGDVLVAILEPEAGEYSVPSKVLSYLTAQRPLLLVVPPENLAARMVSLISDRAD